jgi:CTP-dependent riboflavin kinase
MSESIPKEIIGIAYASEWDHIKQFIKALLEITLNSEEEYSLIVLNAFINNKRYEEYDVQIKSKAQIKLLSSITDFEKISLYQYSEYKRNIINISKDKNVIVLTAQYMGPEIDHTNYFNFAIYLDSFNLPYFSDNKGNIFGCHEIMEIIHKFKPQAPKKIKKLKPSKKLTIFKSEVGTYEKITTKNAIWRENETKDFQKWKMRIHKNFRERTGGFPYYKGKITHKYELYLNNLIKKPVHKKAPPNKSKTKKPIAKKPITKKLADKQKSHNKKLKSLDLEAKIYKKLTGKNAIYGGRITKAFENWKLKILNGFQQSEGGKPYYKGAITQKYEKYLNSL